MSLVKALVSYNLHGMVPVDGACADTEESTRPRLEDILAASGKHPATDRREYMDESCSSASLTLEEKRKAAEAVVDAAICCRGAFEQLSVSIETRAFLVDAVLEDPTLTPKLFTENLFNFGSPQ